MTDAKVPTEAIIMVDRGSPEGDYTGISVRCGCGRLYTMAHPANLSVQVTGFACKCGYWCSPAGASGCGHVPAGYSCVTPGCSNGPAPEPEDLRAEVERLRVERYLCVLAMRCAMGAHHDGVDAMRERLEPVVARYGIATACAARAAISDADAACIEAQYSRSEIAGSSGEPVAKPNPCRNECSLISLDDDHWKCNHCDAVFAYTGAQKPVEKPRCWWPLCKETAGDALCDAVQSALTKGEKP